MEGSKKMMKRPIKEVYGSDASDGLFFVCPTNTGYLKLNGIKQPAKQIPLLPKSS
ncbi:unnamed protein product [Brassica oleracea]